MTEQDKALHRGLMKLLNDGTFQLQARDVPVFSAVYKWAHELPDKIKVVKVEPANTETKKAVKK